MPVMEFRSVERAPGAFQESVSPEQVAALARRAFGAGTGVVSAVELGGGLYNTTYRVDLDDGRRVILRIAPAPDRQCRIERALMRNEHVSLPFFAPIAAMMPRTLFADWTHEVVGRDVVWQTMLDGKPGAQWLRSYPRPAWVGFYHQMGTVTASVHAVLGERFGPVAGPTFATWSDAVVSALEDTVADLSDAGLDAGDVREVVSHADRHRAVLDEIDRPHLLHGDLWVPNVMLDPEAPEPTVTGVLDHDRASWGDPAADWTIHVVRERPGTDRDTFWDTYGRPEDSLSAEWRALVYRARHIAAVRLERHRLGRHDRIADNYQDLRQVLELLATI